MRKLNTLIAALLAFGQALPAYPAAVIFNGSNVKALKQNLDLNGAVSILSGTVDPTSSATSAPAGSLYLNTSNGNTYRKLDAGSSTNWVKVASGADSGTNYIANGDAEANTTGWATYADAAAATPVDCTGGAPTLTWTRSTTSPLRGTGNFLATKDAANRQGEGASYAFTVDRQDQAKALAISLEFEVGSGTFAQGDSANDSDLEVYVYDVTNAALIQPAGYKLVGGATGQWNYKGYFQTASNSQSYRLCLHQAKNGTSAYTLKVDTVKVGPEARLYGAPVTDWVSYTLTPGGSTSAPSKGTIAIDEAKWRRIGDSMEIFYNYRQTVAGSAGSGTYKLPIPSGYSIDTTKVTPSSSIPPVAGSATLFDGTSDYVGYVYAYDSTNLGIVAGDEALDPGSFGSAFIPYSTTTLNVSFHAMVPISGWGSTLNLSNDAETRVVAGRAERITSVQSINSASATKVQLNSAIFDSHGAWDVATNYRYTIPVAGYYCAMGGVTFAANATNIRIAMIYKNGAEVQRSQRNAPSGTQGEYVQVPWCAKLIAGDYLELYAYQDSGGALNVSNSTNTFLNVNQVQGPSTVGATELVAARYEISAGTGNASFADAADEIVDYDLKTYDTHGAVTVGAAWKFTAPVSGNYQVCARINWANGTNMNSSSLFVYKNGASVARLDRRELGSAIVMNGCDNFRLIAGDYIQIEANQDDSASAARSVGTTAGNSAVTVTRVGNY
jgi:hypothetical protein